MRSILIILFILLYFGNSHICTFIYPYDFNDETTHYLYGDWWMLRDVIYECMFLVLIPVGLFRPSKISKALMVATTLLVGCSFIDKAVGITWYHPHDFILIIGFIFVTITVYLHERKK